MRSLALGLLPMGLLLSSSPTWAASDELSVAIVEREVVTLPRVSQPAVIDGVRSDTCWAEARSFRLRAPDGAGPASGTEARVCRDEATLYVLFTVTDPGSERATRPREGQDWRPEDVPSVEILVDMGAEARSYQQLGVSRFNDRLAVKYFGGGALDDREWRPEWQSATTRSKDGFVAEIAVPWASLGLPPIRGSLMGLNLIANRSGANGPLCWQGDVKTMLNPAGFGVVAFRMDKDADRPELFIQDITIVDGSCSVTVGARGRGYPSSNFAFFHRLTVPGARPAESLTAMDLRNHRKSTLVIGPVRATESGPASLIIAAKRKSEVLCIRAVTFMVEAAPTGR